METCTEFDAKATQIVREKAAAVGVAMSCLADSYRRSHRAFTLASATRLSSTLTG